MARFGTPQWGATITEPSGRAIWQSDDTMSAWSFNRVLNDISEGEVTLPVDTTLANRVEPWSHVLTFWAGTDPVWQGVVTKVAVGKDMTVSASDGAVYFKRRRLPAGRTWDQADASQVMQQVVVDAMTAGDPLHVADNLMALDSRVWVVVDETANSVMVSDIIDDLGDAGLDWTFLAGTLLVGPVMSRFRTQQLTDRHLTGDITVTKDGKDVVTDVLVTGEGVWAQRALDGDQFGIQTIEKGDKLVTEAECATLAESILTEQGVTPITVAVADTDLDPDTPISVNDLVPGVIVPVATSRTGMRVGADLRLDEVSFSSGQVSLSFGTPGPSFEDRAEFPPPATMDHQSPWVREQADKTAQSAGEEKSLSEEWTTPGVPL